MKQITLYYLDIISLDIVEGSVYEVGDWRPVFVHKASFMYNAPTKPGATLILTFESEIQKKHNKKVVYREHGERLNGVHMCPNEIDDDVKNHPENVMVKTSLGTTNVKDFSKIKFTYDAVSNIYEVKIVLI